MVEDETLYIVTSRYDMFLQKSDGDILVAKQLIGTRQETECLDKASRERSRRRGAGNIVDEILSLREDVVYLQRTEEA